MTYAVNRHARVIGFNLQAMAPIGYSAEALQFLNRTTGLTNERKAAYAALIDGLVNDGVWSLLDALYVFAAPDATTALLNLKSSSYGASNSGCTFTADEGYTRTGDSQYIDTTFNPSTAVGANYLQNSAHVSGWTLGSEKLNTTNRPLVDRLDNGANPGINIYPQYNADGYTRVNDDPESGAILDRTNNDDNVVSQVGLWLGNRSGATAREAYLNGVSLGTYGSASSGTLPNTTIVFFSNTTGSSSFIISAGSIGGSLNSTKQLALYNRLSTFIDSLWTPATALAGDLVAWYKADVGLYSDLGSTPAVNNDLVKQWNDQSGNNYHLTGTDGRLPTLDSDAVNGAPGVVFTRSGTTSDVLRTTASAVAFTDFSGDGFSVFIVAANHDHNASDSQRLFSFSPEGTGNDANEPGFCLYWNTQRWGFYSSAERGGNGQLILDNEGVGSFAAFGGVFNSSEGIKYFNGGEWKNSRTTRSNNIGDVDGNTIRLAGNESSDNEYHNCTIAEVIFVDRPLTQAEIGKLQNYFRRRWGVPVPPIPPTI